MYFSLTLHEFLFFCAHLLWVEVRASARIEKISLIRVDSVTSCDFLRDSIKFLSTVQVRVFYGGLLISDA